MRVSLRTRGYLQQVFPEKKDTVDVELNGPVSVRGILAGWGIKPDLVMVVLVDGVRQSLDYVPSDGETVTVLPPVAGG